MEVRKNMYKTYDKRISNKIFSISAGSTFFFFYLSNTIIRRFPIEKMFHLKVKNLLKTKPHVKATFITPKSRFYFNRQKDLSTFWEKILPWNWNERKRETWRVSTKTFLRFSRTENWAENNSKNGIKLKTINRANI